MVINNTQMYGDNTQLAPLPARFRQKYPFYSLYLK